MENIFEFCSDAGPPVEIDLREILYVCPRAVQLLGIRYFLLDVWFRTEVQKHPISVLYHSDVTAGLEFQRFQKAAAVYNDAINELHSKSAGELQ